MRVILLLVLLYISLGTRSQAKQDVPFSVPELVGLSSDSLTKADALLQKYVDEKKLPGMVTMVSRHGKIVHCNSYGWMDNEKPMELNTIFRIASMTKPITSVAVMILVDEGRFQLDDPVVNYIPEFKDLKVLTSIDGNELKLEDQTSRMTIRQLLTHTAGFAFGGENTPVDSMYRAANLSDGTLKDMVQKLARLPLLYQPGTRWNYSRSCDILAYLVEVITGKPFDEFLQERIFIPLKMEDTGFYVPAEKLCRVAAVYSPGDSEGINIVLKPDTTNVATPVKFLSGNGGLVSTVSDYWIFSQMLLNKGIYKGNRILNSKTVELMTTNHLTGEIMPSDPFLGPLMKDMGFGLGFAISKANNGPNAIESAGSYWWAGSANTYFMVDPKEELVMVFMAQFVPNFYYPVFREFRELVYQSILNDQTKKNQVP